MEITLNSGKDLVTGELLGNNILDIYNCSDFNQLWEAYKKQVEYFVKYCTIQEEIEYVEAGKDCGFLFISILYDDCIEKGESLLSGGVRYLDGTLESYGNTNTADSLLAIKKAIFEDKIITLPDLVKAMQVNYNGYEDLRRKLLTYPKYGNDDNAADEMAKLVHEHICLSAIAAKEYTNHHSYLVVVINNNANSVLGKHTVATPDGRLQHTFLANANNPTRGMDKNGLTAMLNFLVKLDTSIHAGNVQNLKFSKEMFGIMRNKMGFLKKAAARQ